MVSPMKRLLPALSLSRVRHAVGAFVRVGIQQHRVNDAEDRGGGADAQRQRKDGRRGEARTLAHLPKGEDRVLQQGSHLVMRRRSAAGVWENFVQRAKMLFGDYALYAKRLSGLIICCALFAACSRQNPAPVASPNITRVGSTAFLQLEADSFTRLTPKQQALAYWLTQASIAIDPIIYDQIVALRSAPEAAAGGAGGASAGNHARSDDEDLGLHQAVLGQSRQSQRNDGAEVPARVHLRRIEGRRVAAHPQRRRIGDPYGAASRSPPRPIWMPSSPTCSHRCSIPISSR